ARCRLGESPNTRTRPPPRRARQDLDPPRKPARGAARELAAAGEGRRDDAARAAAEAAGPWTLRPPDHRALGRAPDDADDARRDRPLRRTSGARGSAVSREAG